MLLLNNPQQSSNQICFNACNTLSRKYKVFVYGARQLYRYESSLRRTRVHFVPYAKQGYFFILFSWIIACIIVPVQE